MRYIDIGGQVIPKHCKYGPRPLEGVVFSDYEWWSITDHLYKDQRERELAEVLRAKEEKKKELSLGMTQNWCNTLASAKTQSDQKRLDKIKKDKQDKIDKYNEIIISQKEEKKKILEDVKEIMFQEKNAVKTIKSAVTACIVQKDRQKQIELKNLLKKREEEKMKEWAEKFAKDAADFKREKLKEEIERRAKMKAQKKYLGEQVAENLRRKKAEEETELENQRQDLINMKIELDKIQHCAMLKKNQQKEFAARFLDKTKHMLELEKSLKLEQEEEDEINEIYKRYARRFETERKEREKKEIQDAIEKRNKITEELTRVLEEIQRKERERIEAAQVEKERNADEREEEEKRLRAARIADQLEARRLLEEKMAKERQELEEKKKWELMQLYRTIEVGKEWKETQKRKKKEMQAETAAYYAQQIKERSEREAKDSEELEKLLESDSENTAALLDFCEKSLDLVKEKNAPTYPLLVAIANVKKANGLWKEEEGKDKRKEGAQEKEKPSQKPVGTACYCFRC